MDGPVRAGWGARVSARLADYPLVHGAVISLAVASVGLVVVEFVVLVVWTADTRSVAAASSALRVGADLWLLAHGSALRLPEGRLEVLPFGLAMLPVVLAASAGHRMALARQAEPAGPGDLEGSPRQRWQANVSRRDRDRDRRAPRRRPQALPGTATSWRAVTADVAVVTVAYLVLVCLIALIASDAGARPAVLPAVLITLLLAGAGATVGVLRGSSGRPVVWRALPRAGRDVLSAGAAGAATALALAGVMFVVLLAAGFPEVASATRDLDDDLGVGVVGGVALFAGQAVVLPNVVWWTAAYALGTGVATGGGGVLRPAQADPAQLPDLPVFEAMPTTALPASAWLVLALVPVGSGLVVAVFTRRARSVQPFGAQVVRAVVSAVVCGVILGVGAHLSGASAGADRIGPGGQWTGVAASGEVAVGALVALSVVQLLRSRRGSTAAIDFTELADARSGAGRSAAGRSGTSRSGAGGSGDSARPGAVRPRTRLPGSRRGGQAEPSAGAATPQPAPRRSERGSSSAAVPARRVPP